MGFYIPYHFDMITVWFSKQDYNKYLTYYFIKPYVKGIYMVSGFLAGKLYNARHSVFDKLWVRMSLAGLGFTLHTCILVAQIPNWYDIYGEDGEGQFENWTRT